MGAAATATCRYREILLVCMLVVGSSSSAARLVGASSSSWLFVPLLPTTTRGLRHRTIWSLQGRNNSHNHPRIPTAGTSSMMSSSSTISASEGSNNQKQQQHQPLVVVIAGATGSGKSDVAAEICGNSRPLQHYSYNGGMIVSADSVQAYRGVQIGANKPDAAERARTPHLLLDVASVADDDNGGYNVAAWRRDALFVIRELLGQPQPVEPRSERERRREILGTLEEAKKAKRCRQSAAAPEGVVGTSDHHHHHGDDDDDAAPPFLPVVVGGTMMYLQWLVHGRPDAARPTPEARRLAETQMAAFQTSNDNDGDWEGAVQHVSAQGEIFAQKAQDLSGHDWYRLGRLLEVALTVKDQIDTSVSASRVAELYTGEREGGLASLGYDVRCFFLCPDDRMEHTKVVDRRCEEMIRRGLLTETADLSLSGQLPDMAARAIGYRQTLDYLGRDSPKDNDADAFQEYLEDFTGATRRYAKKQMQWFRKDEEFVFVPVSSTLTKPERIQAATTEMARLINLPRDQYDKERASGESLSAKTRRDNEAQGKGMKFYQYKTQILLPDSRELRDVLREADACTQRFQAKKPRPGHQ